MNEHRRCDQLLRSMKIAEYCDYVLAGRPGFWTADVEKMARWILEYRSKQ